ncbi:MAG: hypothetical protein KDK39_04740 [Leptospiraceae bacterium]|nr:hypothetical protein [Leptospiraceae bacterium]
MSERPKQDALLRKIYTEPDTLDSDELKRIHTDPQMRKDLQFSLDLDQRLGQLPLERRQPPPALHHLVFQRIIRPSYKMWHLILVMILIICSPLMLAFSSRVFEGFFHDNLLITIFVFYGVMVFVLLLPITFYIITTRRSTLKSLMEELDHWLAWYYDRNDSKR